MKPPALLDASVLIPLFDVAHVHHEIAHDWFADNRARGWATSPMTQSALLRICSNPKYGSNAERIATLATRLRAFCSTPDHLFWPDTLSLNDDLIFDLSLAPHHQLTDIYLLALAKANGGVLTTFDRTIPLGGVRGAKQDLVEVLGF